MEKHGRGKGSEKLHLQGILSYSSPLFLSNGCQETLSFIDFGMCLAAFPIISMLLTTAFKVFQSRMNSL
jgi:hypothetical protein